LRPLLLPQSLTENLTVGERFCDGCDTFSSIFNLLIDDTAFIASCMVSAKGYALDWMNILYAGGQTVL